MDIKNIQLDQLEVGTSRYNSICFRDIKTKRVPFTLKALEGFLTTYLQILIKFRPSEIHDEICNKEAAEKSITYIERLYSTETMVH